MAIREMPAQQTKPSIPLYLRDRGDDAPKSFSWWYRLAAPRPAAHDASLEQRELVRRGRLASIVLLIELLIGMVELPIALLGPNRASFGIPMVIYVGIILIALLFNRRGQITFAGTLLVIALESVVMLDILTTPGGVDVFTLPMFDILIQADLIAVSLLPTGSVFIVAGINCLFAAGVLTFAHRTPALLHALTTQSYDAYLRPIVLHVIIAGVTYLWVRGATKAVERADRAEVIARLEHDLAEQTQHIAEQKQQLESSIQQIIETQGRVANGDLTARVPLTQSNVLWQVAGALNNLLARYQRSQQAEHELERTHSALAQVLTMLQDARNGKHPALPERSGTMIDALLIEFRNNNAPFQSSNNV